jgi:hypothetical protein
MTMKKIASLPLKTTGEKVFKKVVEYKDFNGEAQTGTYWFHLSEAEVTAIEMEAVTSKTLGLVDMIEKIVADMKGKEMIAIIHNLVDKSYGVRSTDGARFMKSPELLADFKSTGGYHRFLFELQTNADMLVEWFNGLLPENMVELAEEARKKAGLAEVASAEEARRRSEARMEGFKQKAPTVLVTKTAPPVLEAEEPNEVPTPATAHLTPENRPDLWPDADPELEQFRAWKAQQAAPAQG